MSLRRSLRLPVTDLFNLFYVSETTVFDGCDVVSIADQSQDNNRWDAITGLLLFDGKCWCQYIEGPETSVESLFDRLQRDTRHRDMQVLQHGPVAGERLFPNWRMGFSYVADEEAIQQVLLAERPRALEAFRDIRHSVDERKYSSP